MAIAAKDLAERAFKVYRTRIPGEPWRKIHSFEKRLVLETAKAFLKYHPKLEPLLVKRLLMQAHLTVLIEDGWTRGDKFGVDPVNKRTHWWFLYDDLPGRIKWQLDWLFDCFVNVFLGNDQTDQLDAPDVEPDSGVAEEPVD